MKKLFLFLFLGMFLISLVSAGEMVDIFYKIRLEFEPDCTNICRNVTVGNVSLGTQEFEICDSNCTGLIKIYGIEENHLTIIEHINDLERDKLYTGFYQAELGNASDISGMREQLDRCFQWEEQLSSCMDANRNVSTQLMILEDDITYKSNFTDCDKQRSTCQTNLDLKQTEVNNNADEVDDLKGAKFMWIGFGVIAGALFIFKGLPWLKGRNTPSDESEKQFASNAGY